MELFNTGMPVSEGEPLYKAIYKLMYKGKLAGYRVKAIRCREGLKKEWYFDLDLELVTILNQDLRGYAVVIEPNIEQVNLIPKGSLLVPDRGIEPYEDIDMCDYNKFMKTQIGAMSKLRYVMEDLAKCDYELKVLYNKYNDMLFESKLPYDVPVYYDSKLRMTAGMCNYKRRGSKSKFTEYYKFYIRLSDSYIKTHGKEDDFRNTLIHEMIHVRHPYASHKNEFVYEMNRLNRDFGDKLNIKITVHSLGAGDYNYKYVCKDCGVSFVQVRQCKDLNKYYCTKCRGSFYLHEDRKTGYFYDKDGKVTGEVNL